MVLDLQKVADELFAISEETLGGAWIADNQNQTAQEILDDAVRALNGSINAVHDLRKFLKKYRKALVTAATPPQENP